MLSKLAKRRITKLIQYMRSLPKSAEEHFHMNYWASHDGSMSHWGPDDYLTENHLMSCGTTACPAGWAATMPYFKKLGLHLRAWSPSSADIEGMAVFDLVDSQESELFGAQNRDKTPKAWADRAEKLIKKWEKE